jgi:hypothetical protein
MGKPWTIQLGKHGLFNLENMVYQNILKYKSMNMGHENIVG